MSKRRVKKFDEGGIVKGKSHADGGEHFIVNGSGQHVELEGREAVISAKAFEDDKIHKYTGTNWEILNQINQKYGGNSLYEKVETIGVGDFVICISSVEDETKREYTGTNEQVISAINESGGCISMTKGAKVKEILDGRRSKKMAEGGGVGTLKNGDLVKYNHSPKAKSEAKVLENVGKGKVKIEILEDYRPFTKRIDDPDDWFRKKSFANPDTFKDVVKRGTIKIVSSEKVEVFNPTYWSKDTIFRSKEFNDAFQDYLKGKMAKGGRVGEIYRHKHIPTMTLEITDLTSNGVKGLQKDTQGNKLERFKGKSVTYNNNLLNELFTLESPLPQKEDDEFYKDGGKTIAQTPAPAKDRVYGSDKNKPQSASSASKASSIELNEKTIESIKTIIDAHNDKYPAKRITLAVAKAVVRRGMGAYSVSHRPTISGGKPNSRVAWGLARLKAFLFKAQHGYSKSGKYSQDNDLLNELSIKHKKFDDGGEVKTFYTRTYADGTSQRFSVEDYEKNVLPNIGEGGAIYLAPNGKPSNLTPEQYKLVRTPQFKAWFGDWENDPANASKVVDENGEPLVVYHGTRTRGEQGIFSIFDIERGGESNTLAKVGFWFTPIISFAKNFADNTWWGKAKTFVYAVFLRIKNPKIYTSDDSTWGDSYEKFRTEVYAIDGQTQERANMGGIGYALKNPKETIGKYREMLYSNGYDGIFIKNTRFDRREAGGINDQYVALISNDIKLANGNNTTFDGSNPDIWYKQGGLMVGELIVKQTPEKLLFYNDDGVEVGYVKYVYSDSAFSMHLSENEREFYLDYIEIYPSERNKGYSHFMLEYVKDFAKELGATIITLKADAGYGCGYNDNKKRESGRLERLYASHGFEFSFTYAQLDADTDGELNACAMEYRISQPDNKFKDGGAIERKHDETYEKWRHLVNMSASELEHFYNSEEGKEAGLTASEARAQGIGSGRESARWILKMKKTPKSEWTDEMWRWAGRQVSFISRMSGMKGDLYDDKGRKTRKHLSLLIWGHNPKKKMAGGEMMHLGGDMSKHLAPNGKPSNLTHEQWHLVRTPEFKAWFGDWENDPANASKVVDENGEPLVVWHFSKRLYDSDQRFNVFNVNRQLGSHFGSLKQVENLKYYDLKRELKTPNINNRDTDFRFYQVFLNIKNPSRLKDVGIFEEQELINLLDGIRPIKSFEWEYINGERSKQESRLDRIKELAKTRDVDGVIYLNRYESTDDINLVNSLDDASDNIFLEKIPNAEDSWIAFYPEQIKLADGTNTTFDESNPDIRYAKGGLVAPNGKPSNLTPEQYKLVRTPEFKAWFGDWENDPANASKVVDENGEPLVVYHGAEIADKNNKGRFNIFRKGSYFTDTYESAKYYAFKFAYGIEDVKEEDTEIYSVFLNIKKPKTFEYQTQEAEDFFHDFYEGDNRIKMYSDEGYDGMFWEYDAKIYDFRIVEKEKHFITFYPEQIKLADGTNTTFDGRNPDIRYKQGGDILKGGKADGMSIAQVAAHHRMKLKKLMPEYRKGIKHESEHTDNLLVASEIAKDHLFEDEKYYTKLDKVEETYKQGGKVKQRSKWKELFLFENTCPCNHTKYKKGGEVTLSASNKLKLFVERYVEASSSTLSDNEKAFVEDIKGRILKGEKLNKVQCEKLAASYGIESQLLTKELVELSIVLIAKKYTLQGRLKKITEHEVYNELVSLYQLQPNLSHRTSTSVLLQQYSTPAPIGYLMGLYCGMNEVNDNHYFEPSAGNGMLTLAAANERFDVNEISEYRLKNLRYQGFNEVTNYDASVLIDKPNIREQYDAVITNPPFGSVESMDFDGYQISGLEHIMTIYALQKMKDNGKAAIIIGGHNKYDELGRVQGGKNRNFISYLYAKYNVDDIINIDGHKLYQKMGTGFDVRIILINGRHFGGEQYPPLVKSNKPSVEVLSPEPIKTFDELWTRVNQSIK